MADRPPRGDGAAVERVFREEYGRLIASLVRRFGDIDLAEDAAGEDPYRAWQVLGCALSISVAAVLAYLWVPSVWAVFVLAAAADLGFACAWAVDAASTDESGLWVVGLVFLVVGGGIGLLVLLAVTAIAATRRPSRRRGND